MPGERIGRLYEALVFVAVKKALNKKYLSSPITWNPSGSNLMVQPDVCIGNPSSPEVIVLITRSGARRGWDKKFWRNVGEIIDIRSHYPTAQIANITLGTEIKEELMEALSFLVNVSVFPNRETREEIEKWIQSIEKSSPAKQEQLEDFLEKKIEEANSDNRKFVLELGESLTSLQSNTNPSWGKVNSWLAERREAVGSFANLWDPPSSIRRGLAKLLTLGEPEEVLKGIDKKLNLIPKMGVLLDRFGWASKSIAGWKVSDPEIISVIKVFNFEEIERILNRSASLELRTICADITSVDWITATCDFLLLNRENFKDSKWLFNQLVVSFKDHTLSNQISAFPPNELKGSWLFRVLMALIKLASGIKQGYGYEQLINDIRLVSKDERITGSIIEMGGSLDRIIRAGTTDSLRRKLVDWVSGLRDVELEDWQIFLISYVISQRFTKIKPTEFNNACKQLTTFLQRTTYEDRIAPYRFFEPLKAIIELKLESHNIPFRFIPRHETLVSEISSSTRNPGTTPVICVNSNIIHWKSAHGSHTSDKTKELCGRGFCLRHRIDKKNKVPVEMPLVKKLILVLDGDFTAKEIEHLFVAGWDEIFRPNQMDKLVKAIV